ncbi:MAG: hypothetical protein ISEC1_P1928 [Thiomicrorhabdus sp.]|nr:MAG: hypothetical protein ISEC1_P1928 [Thiomicrorhabdus sp.]
MFPDKINTANSITITEPVKIQLSLGTDTMLFLGMIALAGLVYGAKRLKSN